MHKTLVIMAAGMGSRYGGSKQVTGFGPNGEWLCEYSAYDAIRAGFDRIVFVIKPAMLDMVKERAESGIATKAEVCYAFQDYSSLPAFYTVPEGREKPYGTVHAVLCAAEYVDGPFAVLNADDYYGPVAFECMSKCLDALAETGEAVMVAYPMKNTLSAHGTVTRGICESADGRLTAVKETKAIGVLPDGTVADLSGETPVVLDASAPVSMNFWGYTPWMLGEMRTAFEAFLRSPAGAELKSEMLLPVIVDAFMQQNRLTVKLTSTDSQWFGVTYIEDKPMVVEKLKALHDGGVYPAQLWK